MTFVQVCFSSEKQKNTLASLIFLLYVQTVWKKHLSYYTIVINVFVLIVDGLVHFFFFFFLL